MVMIPAEALDRVEEEHRARLRAAKLSARYECAQIARSLIRSGQSGEWNDACEHIASAIEAGAIVTALPGSQRGTGR